MLPLFSISYFLYSPVYTQGPSPVNGPFKPLFVKAVCKSSVVIESNPCVNASDIESFTLSSSCDIPVLSFASDALFNIPFCPVSMLILIPTKINKTIIVTTNAINVIPLFLLNFCSKFISFPPFPFSVFHANYKRQKQAKQTYCFIGLFCLLLLFILFFVELPVCVCVCVCVLLQGFQRLLSFASLYLFFCFIL